MAGVWSSAQRALRSLHATHEREVEQIVVDLRHDPDYAREAQMQVLEDLLSSYGLSKREVQIAALQMSGQTAEATGEIAGITVSTVRFHMGNVYKKVGVSGKRELRAKVAAALDGTQIKEEDGPGL